MTFKAFFERLPDWGWQQDWIVKAPAIRRAGCFQGAMDQCPVTSLGNWRYDEAVTFGVAVGLSRKQVELLIHAADNPEWKQPTLLGVLLRRELLKRCGLAELSAEFYLEARGPTVGPWLASAAQS